MKRFVAEALGTYMLVFCGTGAIVTNQVSEGIVGHAGIAITFGLVVTAMIYSLGKISGAHINPAVSIGFAVLGMLPRKEVFPFIIAQVSGGLLASCTLFALFPDQQTLGETLPAGTEMQSLILEFLLTFILMFVILFVSQSEEFHTYTGFVVGGVVLMEAYFAGPICGASMNPARSIGPALVAGNLTSLWLYIVAPVAGAIAASYTWKYLRVD